MWKRAALVVISVAAVVALTLVGCAMVIELAEAQALPPGLVQALRRCTQSLEESRAYICFVLPRDPNTPGAQWQFDRNVLLEGGRHGTLVLDILRDGRVGGVEFLKRL